MAKLGRRPKIFIADVQNQTSEAYFPIADLNDELLNEFSFSGDYILIDNNAREKLLKEIREDPNKWGDISVKSLIVKSLLPLRWQYIPKLSTEKITLYLKNNNSND